jgi:hypothetical protein
VSLLWKLLRPVAKSGGQIQLGGSCRIGVDAGIRQSRSCGLKQLKRALRVAGVVAVGGGDIGVAVQQGVGKVLAGSHLTDL